jgi:SAM-dependent methyltransferase
MRVVRAMLELARIKKGDVIYDLGSGDGRIVITAAKKYGAKGVGIEINPRRAKTSRANAEGSGVSHLVEIREQDLLTADVSPASVVTLYLLPDINKKLMSLLRMQLRPGARVLSIDSSIGKWKPTRVRRVDKARIFLWVIREKKQKRKIRRASKYPPAEPNGLL